VAPRRAQRDADVDFAPPLGHAVRDHAVEPDPGEHQGQRSVIAYAALQRTNEIGVRAALGASPRDVLGLVVGDGLALMLRGLLIGTALTLLTSPLVRTLLFRPTADDAVAYLAAPIVLLGVGLLSCALPAWRATKLNPVIALRAE